jgi:uncharacterized protein
VRQVELQGKRVQVALSERVERDIIDAMKARDTVTLSTLRLLKSEAKNAQVAKGAPLDEEEYLAVLTREAKRRREAAAEYDRAGRTDLSDRERAELAVLDRYRPHQLDAAEISAVLQQVIGDIGAKGPEDVNKVMQRAMPALRGRADGAQVRTLARELLSTS